MRPNVFLRQQSGLGLISVIFLITVGALIAAAMASLMQLGQKQTVQSFSSTRAMQAAESGIQLQLNQLMHPQTTGGCSATNTATTSYAFTAAGIAGCSAQVVCTVTQIDSVDYVALESVGQCGQGANALDLASRRIKVRAIRP